MTDKSKDIIDISIRIGNSPDWSKIPVGGTFTYRVNRDTFISELKEKITDEYDDENTKNIINRYQIYNNNIIRMYDNNIVSDAFNEPRDCDLDLIDKNQTLFYALLI